MNIWVIGRSYPMEINNMQGSFELEQAKMLAKYGHNVTYIACIFHPFKKIKKWGVCNWSEDGIKVFTYSQFYAIERMKVHFEPFKKAIWEKLLQIVEEDSGVPEVIHVHYPSNITIADMVLNYQNKGSRVICTEHWSQVLTRKIDAYEQKQLTKYVNDSDSFLCVGPPLKKAVLEITKTNKDVEIIPNILNELFVPREKVKDEFRFVAIGVLFPYKQFDKIIQAFYEQFRDYSGVKLYIVGGGVEEKAEGACKEVKPFKTSGFTGKLYREQTAKVVGEADALICYSCLETFGVPIIEAWGCGIPVIATTAAAVNEKWDTRLGEQIAPNNTQVLGEKMKKLFNSIDSYDTEYIRNYAVSHYSEEMVYRKLMDKYVGRRNDG